jgi:predicted metal-dependent phosphotriesterase family hydrolase
MTKINLCFGYRYSSKYNCQFNDAETHAAVLYEMELYKKFGGGAVVENTNHGLQRNVKFLKEVSQRTGIHVIAGTGRNDADFQTLYLVDNKMSFIINICAVY